MKKLLSLSCIILCMMFSIELVDAKRYTCEDVGELIATDSFRKSSTVDMNICMNNDCSTTKAEVISIYLLKDGKGFGYTTYCRNPEVTTGKTDVDTKYKCIETLLGKDTDETYEKKVYNAGIVEILTQGFNLVGNKVVSGNNKNKLNAQESANYAGVVLALRLYEMMWRKIDTNDINGLVANEVLSKTQKQNILKGYRYQVNLLLKDEEIAKKVQEIENKGEGKGKVDWIKPFNDTKKLYSWYHEESGTNITGQKYNELNGITSLSTGVLNRARDLILKAFKASYKFQTEGMAELIYQKTLDQIKEDVQNNKLTREIEYTLDAKNFKSSNAYIKIAELTCKNCKQNNISYKLFIKDEEISLNNLKNENLKPSSGSGKITFKIIFTADSEEKLKNVNYEIKVNYYDESINTEAFTFRSSECPSNTTCQNFYVLYRDGSNVVEELVIKSKEDTTPPEEPPKNTCVQLLEQCSKNNQEACNKWERSKCGDCEDLEAIVNGKKDQTKSQAYKNGANYWFKRQYDNKCTKECGTNIINAECSNDPSDINFKEGTEVDKNACTSKNEEHILQCIVDEKDEAGNSYQAVNIVNNDYCSVWCKEDYYLKMPANQYVNSGRYFTLQAEIEGTKTCYTSLIDKYQFEVDYKEANKKVKEAYNKYKNNTGTESQLKAEINKLETIIRDYNSCSLWEMDYNFNPKIEFWYEESYMNTVKTNIFETSGAITKESAEVSRCDNYTEDKYTECVGGWNTDNDNRYEALTLNTCYKKEDGNYACGNKTYRISKTLSMKSTIKASGKYITPSQFYSIYPSGALVTSNSGNVQNGSLLPNALPVSLKTRRGTYNYVLSVKDLGEYYDSDALGRIWGADRSVVSVILDEQSKNQNCSNGALTNNIQINGQDFENGVYTCAYTVNCPNCPFECDPPGDCELECPDCPMVCDPPCIFDRGDINISYRPITNDNLNPSDRPLGSNWNTDGEVNTALEMKAEVTTKEIEENGENIFDMNFTSDNEEFSMEVTLDGKLINWIRKYNDKMKNKGGYLNNSLECYNHSYNGEKYNNIYCYSTFIDQMIEDNNLETDNMFSVKRPMDIDDRKNYDSRTGFEGYWTTWSLAKFNSAWNINTTIELEATKKYNGTGIGPAWK